MSFLEGIKGENLKAKREELRQKLQEAIKNNDTEAFGSAFNDLQECIGAELRAEFDGQLGELQQELDSRILTARGVHQLTGEEKKYYQKVAEAMKSSDPKQALSNLDVTLPETVINSVSEDLRTNHPLLSRINFIPSGGAVKLLLNTNGAQSAVWGSLCDKIVKELLGGFKEVNTTLLKLSAFLPVCKAMLELGPEWLDRFVRETLYEALANGLEAGIVSGDGDEEPIGMIRQVGEGVSVVGGVYPAKEAIAVSDFSAQTIGNLLSLMAVDDNGKPRNVEDVILIVNPQDYRQKVMPATTLRAPDGTYRNDVLPYPMTVLQSAAVTRGYAVLGIAKRYAAFAGTAKEGRIAYSDHYQFLEDNRVYLIKAYANGMPADNHAFLYLDISGLQPTPYKVEVITPAPSDDATLADLKIGSLTLSPAFGAEVTTYTAATTNTTNTLNAVPADAGATIVCLLGSTVVENGSALTWAAGANVVKVVVTAADGTTTKTYQVTVTKS